MFAVMATILLLAQPQAPRPPQAPPVELIHAPKAADPHRVTLKDGWTYRFDAAWTEADIREWVAKREVSRPALPFPAARIAERDDPLALPVGDDNSPWPESIPFPKGMVRYERAKFSQEIAVTNGRDRITAVSRERLAGWARQSGGMEGIKGYRSDTYRLGSPTVPFVANLPVLNSLGYIQHNRGWTRSYPEGARFDDVLSNTETGKVFEHRSAVKKNGAWSRKVIFSDESQRPAGYAGLKGQTCASCHEQAGTGGYAEGMIPGADSIISDPVPALEQ